MSCRDNGDRRKMMTLPVEAFLSRFFLHVLVATQTPIRPSVGLATTYLIAQ